MRHVPASILLSLVGLTASAQSAVDDFEKFRSEVMGSYAGFRNDILSDYAKFLDGIWEEHERFAGESRSARPKPKEAPVAPARETPPAPAALPTPKPEERKPEPADNTPAPLPDLKPAARGGASVSFDFYGLPLQIDERRLMLNRRLANGSDFAAQWRRLLNDPAAADMTARLADLARQLGLNDYLTFELVRRYVNGRYADSHSTARTALAHFLLTAMGFDVRPALSGNDGVLLVPVKQTVFGRPYMVMNGEKFYVFADSDNFAASNRISTCNIPENTETGRAIDMRFTRPLNLPEKPYEFNIEANGLKLSGTVNENIYPLLYRYPQTDMAVYATSVIDPALRARLVEQLKAQLAGRPGLDAVNALLGFTQNAFDYASDEVSHGFEKPYFIEEWLYYPQNDCEDRAVFYTYMLWNVLGVENQLLTYPGHESSSVRLDEPLNGDNYQFDGHTFYISDPTYIGATTGMCMPDFVSESPVIEFHYK